MTGNPGRLLALDLFCGAGGAARGLLDAGWDVVGVDADPRCAAVYPGPFLRADWKRGLELLIDRCDLVWASPPCQRWAAPTALTRDRPSAHPDLIGEVRAWLAGNGVPHVIENVSRAPVRCDLALTGPMVGLPELRRLRHFEMSWRPAGLPTRGARPAGSVAEGTLVSVTTQGGIPCRATRAKRARLRPDLRSSRFLRGDMLRAMGLPEDCGFTMRQIGEAVPPRYAEAVGRQALRARGADPGVAAAWLADAPGWDGCRR